MEFAYSDLEAGFIRLFKILPDADEDEVALKMVHKKLLQTDQALGLDGEKPEYHALSYTWSPETAEAQISVNGVSLKIRKNLWSFLWRLRWRVRITNEAAWFWAGGICINQGNMAEKTKQVAIMSSIYSSAWGVLAWLGEAADNSDIALVPDLVLQVLSTGDFSSGSSQLAAAQYQLPMWQALVAITRRPYWRRAWVMQEIALAQHYIYVMCGEASEHYRRFAGSIRAATLPPLCNDIFTSPPDPEADQQSPIQKIRHIVQELARFDPPHYNKEPDPLLGAHVSKKRLFDLLLDYAHKECSEPRDKIFSLLAMAADTREGGHPLKVDYSKSVEELFFQVLAFCRTPHHESWGTSFATFGRTLYRSLGLSTSCLLEYLRAQENTISGSSLIQEFSSQYQLSVYFKSIGTVRHSIMIDIPVESYVLGARPLPINKFEILPNIQDPDWETETRSLGFSIIPSQEGDRVYQALDSDLSLIMRTSEHEEAIVGWALVLPDSEWLAELADLVRLILLLDHNGPQIWREVHPTDAEIFEVLGEPRYAIQVPLPVALCVIAGCYKPHQKAEARISPPEAPECYKSYMKVMKMLYAPPDPRRDVPKPREKRDGLESSQDSVSSLGAGNPPTDQLEQAHSPGGSHSGQLLSRQRPDSDVERPPGSRESRFEVPPRAPIDLETAPATVLAKKLHQRWEEENVGPWGQERNEIHSIRTAEVIHVLMIRHRIWSSRPARVNSANDSDLGIEPKVC